MLQWPDALGFERAFYVLLLDGAENGGFEPEWLLAMMASESGLIPTAYNKNGGAQGLSQLMPQTLRNLHVAVDGFRHLHAHEQLPTTLEYFRYWRNRFKLERWTCRQQMYLCNFLPALLPIATVPDYVIVDKLRSPTIYAANSGLDANHDGHITLVELDTAILHAINGYSKKRYEDACASLAAVRAELMPASECVQCDDQFHVNS